MARVYVIILNWNGWLDTIQCLESLFGSDYPDFKIIVCDNCSGDGSMEKIAGWAEGKMSTAETIAEELQPRGVPRFKKPIPYVRCSQTEVEQGEITDHSGVPLFLVQNDANRGFSAGNNVGIRLALQKKADYIWLLNNDTVVTVNTLKELVYRVESDDSFGLVGAVIYYAADPSKIQMYGGGNISRHLGVDRLLHAPGYLNYISGTSLFIKREVVEQIGLLDEGFFFFWEDVDYSRRALEKGWKLGVASNAVVYHKFSASVGGRSLKADLFKAAALTRYFKKHYKIRGVVPILYNGLGMIINRLLRRQFDRIIPIVKEFLKAIKLT